MNSGTSGRGKSPIMPGRSIFLGNKIRILVKVLQVLLSWLCN